jgi:hypothetical protein
MNFLKRCVQILSISFYFFENDDKDGDEFRCESSTDDSTENYYEKLREKKRLEKQFQYYISLGTEENAHFLQNCIIS